MPPRRAGRSSSLALDLEFDAPSPLDDSVSTLRTAARVLSDISGVLSKFPFVKPLAAVIVVVCEIFENVKSNDMGWDTLAKQAVSLIIAVAEKQREDSTNSVSSLSTHCDVLIAKLEEVRSRAHPKSSRHWMKKVLRNSIDKDLQAEFKRFLDHACLIFQIQTLMDIDMRTMEVQTMVLRLNETLIASETKLENVQASVIKLEERQLLDRLSNIEKVKYNPGNICTPGTRVGILREVEIWASDFSPPLVASLRGKAGIGKSTVAHTVANSFSNMSCLAASYFFSRDVAMSRPLKNLLPELSRQLAFRIPSFRHALCAALESDDFPVFPQQQLLKLFIEPLRTSVGQDHAITRPWIIVLDALDECEDDIRDCILLLTEALSEFQGKLKLVITSRPEAAIDAVQRLRQTRILNIDLESVENESDIRIFLELGLGSLRAQPGWPTIDPIQKLVMLAGGLFIWAAIVIEFLLESDTLSEEIELILNGTRWEDNPEKRLAQMYHIILEKAYLSGKREVHFRLFLPVLATVLVVSEPQSDIVIGHLAGDGVRYEHLRRILEGLSAALHIPPDSPVVRTTHPSFYRYLTGDCKDDRFAVHSATHSRRLGQRCLTIIFQKVHRDMCDIMGHVGVPHTRIGDFRNRVSEYISQEVQYASKNWILHITAHPDIPIDSQTMQLLNEFFRLRLLPWIEVMAFLDSIDAARESLGRLKLWLKKLSFPDQNLVESTTDALMFLREFSHVITNNPVQVHVSALHFTPRSSTIWKNFMELPNYSTLVKSGAETHWPSTQMSLKSTTSDRRCVSFSPDGRLLAEIERLKLDVTSPVPTGTVQIWDLDGFFTVYVIKLTFNTTIDRDKLDALELVFSPDSEVLLVSHTHSVQVLNFRQKYEPDVYMLPNNIEHTTTAVAPNGSAFALGSPDNAIEIWQVTPPELYRKAGHGCPISLSDSGAKLLYSLQNLSDSSCNRTLKCWHADTGILVDIPDSQSHTQLLSANGIFILLLAKEHLSVHDSNTGSLLFQKQFLEWDDPWTTLHKAELSPDSNHLALAVVEEDLRVSWIYIIEMKSGRLKAAYPGTGPLAWSPSGTILVFQDPDGGIFLLAQSTNDDMLLTFSGHKSDAQASYFVVSPDAHFLVQCIPQGEIPLLTLTSHTKSDTPQLRFSTDGPVFTEKNGETSLLGTPSGPSPLDGVVDNISESTNHSQLAAFATSSNGCLIATLSDAGLIAIYDANTGEQEGVLQTRLTNANYIQFASDGNFIAVTYKPTSVSRLTDLSQTGGRQSEIWNTASQRVVYHSNVYQILRFYPNGHNLVCGSFRKAQDIKTLDLDAANVRGSQVALALSFDPIRIHPTLAFSTEPDAHRVAGIELDHGSVYVWDTKRLLRPRRVDIPQCYEGAPLTELALSADGRTLAAASLNCILIWILESDSDSLLPTLVGHESFAFPRPHFPSFSPDSQILGYVSNHARKLWDVTKSQFLTENSVDNKWQGEREWHGDHHYGVGHNTRFLSLYRARDMTGFPDTMEHSGDLRCVIADGQKGLFSQPGLEVYIPSYKLPRGPILFRLNESRATVSWYWIQEDGRLVLLELPAP